MYYGYSILCFLVLKYAGADVRNYKIMFDRVIVSSLDPEIFEKLDIQVVEAHNRSCIDATQILNKRVTKLMIRSVLDIWKSNSQHMRLFDMTYNWCDLVQQLNKNRLLKTYAVAVQKFANIDPKCPLEANVTLRVRNMYFDEQDLPSFMPLGRFRCLFEYSIGQKIRARINLNGRVIAWHNGK
ncbi:hypothetical protein KR018_004815 [Drosophila ironensis]|nr:hypothetical protein KR018_004815 [Drosophila ironensis]